MGPWGMLPFGGGGETEIASNVLIVMLRWAASQPPGALVLLCFSCVEGGGGGSINLPLFKYEFVSCILLFYKFRMYFFVSLFKVHLKVFSKQIFRENRWQLQVSVEILGHTGETWGNLVFDSFCTQNSEIVCFGGWREVTKVKIRPIFVNLVSKDIC